MRAWLQKHIDLYHWALRAEHYIDLGVCSFKFVGQWLHIPICCLLLAAALCAVAYNLWCWRERYRLLDAAQYAPTSLGLVEYKWYGSGPIVLFLHGTPGGSDQGGLWHRFLLGGDRFSLLAPSRFGYVGTQPEKSGKSAEGSPSLAQQAESLSELIHSLKIDKVAVVGIGGGGPLAMELARTFPHQCWALILVSAVTHKWQPPEVESFRKDLDSLERFAFRRLQGFFMWNYYLLSKAFPAWVLRSLYAEGSSLDHNLIKNHVNAVMEKPMERLALERAAKSCLPPSLRSGGIELDHALFASLPEKIDMSGAASVPTLIIHGKEDKSIPCSHAEAAHSSMPWSELHLVEAGSNMLWLGQEGKATSRKIVSFLMGIVASGQVDEMHHYTPTEAAYSVKAPAPPAGSSSNHQRSKTRRDRKSVV